VISRTACAWIVLGATAWLALLALGVAMYLGRTPPAAGFDLELLLLGGRRVASGLTPYDPALIAGAQVEIESLFYSYPPVVAQAMSLVAAVPSPVVLLAWAAGATVTAVGVAAVIAGCLALAYTPPEAGLRKTRRRWMAYAGAAILIWGVAATLIRYAYRFPGAHEANMALFLGLGGLATLGVYGLARGRRGAGREWGHAFGPMATMAIGSLLAAIAYKHGPASIVTPLSGAYPVVTLGFAWAILRERPSVLQWAGIVSVLVGMVLTTAAG